MSGKPEIDVLPVIPPADLRPANEDVPAGAADPVPEAAPAEGSLAAGTAIIAGYVRTLPRKPGVYRMIDAKGDVLYVGKARLLKSRVASYTQPTRLSTRLMRMVSATVAMEFVVTDSEAEALLLENNLIKRFKPRFNVLLRDDKSFPYIVIRRDHAWPQLAKHRGARNETDEYFGPFASAGAVNRTLYTLQRAFPLRSCSDSIFANRTRPCLQYQIKRCVAPCVGRVTDEEYGSIVDDVRGFLGGKSREVQSQLSQRMETASANLEFERAAVLRDRIRALTAIQSHQSIEISEIEEADVFAAHEEGGQICVQVFFVRAGNNLGNKAYFPSHGKELEIADVLSSFVGQFYSGRPVPREILVSHPLPEADLLAAALSLSTGNRRIEIICPQRGPRRDLMEHALANAREALGRRVAESASQRKLLDGVAQAFGLDAPPQRIEVYDNSHIQGSDAVGGMIVAGPEGFQKNHYRKFNIRTAAAPGAAPAPDGAAPGISAGDDYGMMREVLTRRFKRALKEDPARDKGLWPDLVLIDGGLGQLNAALEVFTELAIDDVALVSIAKGPDRDAGRERFFMPGRPPFSLEARDPVLYFLQRLRDEAHRFAIGTHRTRRSMGISRSGLDEVPGIGAARKRALLHHFGSARAVATATLEDLQATPGVSRTMAKKIYDHFRSGG
ncbi:excinuclease ABC subunit UvrC [Vineibacter terrae]|uniref:UvrABC system protein C n=1 Tax=Vineibacter terrae TaxID=2586908 RepID=A0A5C8P7Q3_9HYPH|nr:excinuclease ABC subunit UvrC [Vineibacter terrae]TXL69262.1 excinuclease ABC subunit UvrC [Vineibacter terrae]